MKLFITASLLFLSINLIGQNTLLIQADNYFDDYRFEQCIPFYLEALQENNVDTFYIKTRLAEAYRKSQDAANAVHWYGQILRHPKAKPIYYFYYSLMLRDMGYCDCAKAYFMIYNKLEPDEKFPFVNLKCTGQIRGKGKSAENLKPKIEQLPYRIDSLSCNSRHDDLGMTFHQNNLLFSSYNEASYQKDAETRPWESYVDWKLYLSNQDTLYIGDYEYQHSTIPKEIKRFNKYNKLDLHYVESNS